MKQLRIEVKQGIIKGGKTINALRFADDIAFCAETEDDLQNILVKVNSILWNKNGMRLNKQNTEIMMYSKTNSIQLNIKINNTYKTSSIL